MAQGPAAPIPKPSFLLQRRQRTPTASARKGFAPIPSRLARVPLRRLDPLHHPSPFSPRISDGRAVLLVLLRPWPCCPAPPPSRQRFIAGSSSPSLAKPSPSLLWCPVPVGFAQARYPGASRLSRRSPAEPRRRLLCIKWEDDEQCLLCARVSPDLRPSSSTAPSPLSCRPSPSLTPRCSLTPSLPRGSCLAKPLHRVAVPSPSTHVASASPVLLLASAKLLCPESPPLPTCTCDACCCLNQSLPSSTTFCCPNRERQVPR